MNEMDLTERLSQMDSRCRSNTKRLDRMEQKQEALEKLASSLEVLAAKEERTERDIREIKEDVKTLVEKPGRRWEKVADKVILAVLGALMAALLLRLGLPI